MSFSCFRADHAQGNVLAEGSDLHGAFRDDRRVFAFVAEQCVNRGAECFRGASAPAQAIEVKWAAMQGDNAHAVLMKRVRFNPQSAGGYGHGFVHGLAPHQGKPQRGGGDWFQHRVILLLCRNMAKAIAFVMRNGSAVGARSCT